MSDPNDPVVSPPPRRNLGLVLTIVGALLGVMLVGAWVVMQNAGPGKEAPAAAAPR